MTLKDVINIAISFTLLLSSFYYYKRLHPRRSTRSRYLQSPTLLTFYRGIACVLLFASPILLGLTIWRIWRSIQ